MRRCASTPKPSTTSTSPSFEVSLEEREEAVRNLDPELRGDSAFAIERVRAFAEAQRDTILPLEVEPLPGLHLGHRVIPIERIGAYVPGGRYPLLSAPIMTIVPAKTAGCDQVIACLPPTAHVAMIAGCHLSGADRIFRVGGAQAIAAMAFGTESVPAVDKIVGPGNAYVNEAKRQVFGPVGIDQLAGPSEIFIVADKTGNPKMIATDLLGQAEHDVRTRVGLITTDADLAQAVLAEVDLQLESLTTADVAGPAWRDYGSLFIGELASVVYADKCCGTNHTLPTMSASRYTGGLWVGSYLKICTHQRLDARGVATVAPHAIRQSANEGLEGHRRAAAFRCESEAAR